MTAAIRFRARSPPITAKPTGSEGRADTGVDGPLAPSIGVDGPSTTPPTGRAGPGRWGRSGSLRRRPGAGNAGTGCITLVTVTSPETCALYVINAAVSTYFVA